MTVDRDLAGRLRRAGVARGGLVGLAVAPDWSAAVAPCAGTWGLAATDAGSAGALAGETAGTGPAGTETDPGGWVVSAAEVAAADTELRPRWVTWSGETAARLTAAGVRLATCWDIAAVHRLLFGGWRADPGWAWAHLRGLPPEAVPADGPPDLFGTADLFAGTGPAQDDPVGPGGYLRAEWTAGGWADSAARLVRWARLACEAAGLQRAALGRIRRPASGTTAHDGRAPDGKAPGGRTLDATAHSESAAELLCAELEADGLPVDRAAAERLLAGIIGPRPAGDAEAAASRAERDERVLRHAPAGVTADLRSPVQVRALLGAAGIDVPDTRAWRLEPYRDAHPLVAALLEWRKAERIATTYGYAWLDAYLGADGRLRGAWTGSDGAAGRMTASAGLHNMPAVLRRAVIAADGFLFVRADLGQIEPRVLAAVSGDRALAAATAAGDLYLPVAGQLGVDRPTAKVAMIAAMYGQTTGHGGEAGRRMKAAYPVAMAYLDNADRQARAGRDLRTYGGRLIRMPGGAGPGGAEPPARVAARGRYGRNAMIQGAAAELFKMWAVTVRTRAAPLGARIVLCLHDELLVHVPGSRADDVARLVTDCLAETARRWAPGAPGPASRAGENSGAQGPGGRVRFLADVSAVRCWADAKSLSEPGQMSIRRRT